jgi:SAM-dependent methyltransferase
VTTFEVEWRARFERFARTYADDARISGWSEAGLRQRVQLFQRVLDGLRLPSTGSALDVGCGGGTYVRLLAGLGYRAVGVDYSAPSLRRALEADPGRKGRYAAGEAYGLPFRDAVFDLVVCIGVLQALAGPERGLDEMRRVLRPGGILVVEALNDRALPARVRQLGAAARGVPARVRSYDPADVCRWLNARGFTVVRRAGLWLPPRRWPRLGIARAADVAGRVLEHAPVAAVWTAHAFLFVARGPAASMEFGR